MTQARSGHLFCGARRLSLGLALTLGGVLSACNSSPTSTPVAPAPTSTATPVTPAGPQSFAVIAGTESQGQAYQALTFYPSAITIDAGDSITWTVNTDEPHTISFPLPGATPVAPTDPTAQAPAGGTTVDGTTYVSSGFLLAGKTVKLTFPKPGTYTYYSLPQAPIATGTVVVQAAGSAYPLSQASIASAAASSASLDLSNAQASVKTVPYTPGSNMIAAGVSPSTKGGATSTVMRYLGGPTESDNMSTTIAVGTTLTFKNLSNNVPHTVTLPALGGTPPPGPPFQAAAGGNTYDGTQLVNSGPIPPGGTFSVTFTAAGTYSYVCLFHAGEGMVGTITVTAGPTTTASPVPTATPTAVATAQPQVVDVNFNYKSATSPTYGTLAFYAPTSAAANAAPISAVTGSKIIFANTDSSVHTASGLGTAGFPSSFDNSSGATASGSTIDGGTTWSSGALGSGSSSGVFTLGAPGTYYFGCYYHYSIPMEDVIISTTS